MSSKGVSMGLVLVSKILKGKPTWDAFLKTYQELRHLEDSFRVQNCRDALLELR